MIVYMNANWRIRSDGRQWIIEKRLLGAKAARHAWKPIGYYTSFFGAVAACAQRQVRELPGVYGPDALPPLAAALDAIEREVETAIATQSKKNPEAAATACRACVPPSGKGRHEHEKDR